MADQRPVGVDHALRLARGPRRVHDDHPVRRGDLGLGRGEHVGPDLAGPTEQRGAGSTPGASTRQRRRGTRSSATSGPTRPATAAGGRGRAHRWPTGACRRSRATGTRWRSSRTSTSAPPAGRPARCGVENVLNGSVTAPMRAAASHATTKSVPLGSSRPTWVPAPTPDGQQRPGQLGRASVGLGVGERVVVADQQDRIRSFGGTGPEERTDR